MKALQQIEREQTPRLETDLPTNKPAANDVVRVQHGVDALRDLLDRSCVASRYSKLSDQQKAMILYGAKLKPSTHINIPLDKMTACEREQIRLSIIALCEINNTFGRAMLSRDRFNMRPKLTNRSRTNQLEH
ncbi:hypothetical protein [Shewanella sp. 10N.286.54.B9]|uniref:hypothetical protein n=1 Tax=Shewanella sp. 10N.286.54.B9 TaxID=3229719 RepID=UPI0035516867